MLTCKEASALVSQSIDRPLPLGERWALRLHLLLCDACTCFKRQVEFLHEAAQRYARRDVPAARQLRLSTEARVRIQNGLARDR